MPIHASPKQNSAAGGFKVARESKLVAASAGASTARNAIALVTTLGLASGIDYRVNAELVAETIERHGLTEKIRNFVELRQFAEEVARNIEAHDQSLIRNAQPKVEVDNLTGFRAPDISSGMLRYSLSRTWDLAPPSSVDLTSSVDPFADVRADIRSQEAGILQDPVFDLSCQPFTYDIFRGTLDCPESVTVQNGLLQPPISVTIDKIDAGVRYPDFAHDDGRLSVRVDDGGLVVANMTQEFVEVLSIAVYADREVRETDLEMSLAPGTENRTPMSMSRLAGTEIERKFTINGVRRSDLSGRFVSFGVAIKYRIGNQENFRTLYATDNVELVALVP